MMASRSSRRAGAGWRDCSVALARARRRSRWRFPRAAPSARRATILVVGDSLSAEYGLARGSGWVALLEQRLAARAHQRRASSTRASAATRPPARLGPPADAAARAQA